MHLQASLASQAMEWLLTFLWHFLPYFSLILSLHSKSIYPLLRLISWNLTIWCLAVTGSGSVDECSRLSFWMHYNIILLTDLITYLRLLRDLIFNIYGHL